MSSKIKAIQTIYKGHKFRSRLEARWALFFDELDIKWMYEPEGYELNDGVYYLPDFYLPFFDGGLYCEVKFDGGDFSKARLFRETTGLRILECEGTPDHCGYRINQYNSYMHGVFYEKYVFEKGCPGLYEDEGCNLGKLSKGSKIELKENSRSEHLSKISLAIIEAQQARFEYGRLR